MLSNKAVSNQVDLPVLASMKHQRVTWPAIKQQTDKHGNVLYPFTTKENLMDDRLVCHLLVEHPYKLQYGLLQKEWEKVASLCNDEKDNDGQLIYQPPVKSAALQKRFDKYIAFVKDEHHSIPFCSGADDEKEPYKLLVGLEDLFDDYDSFLVSQEALKELASAQKKKDKEAAESIHDASLLGYMQKTSATAAASTSAGDTTSINSTGDDDNGQTAPPPKHLKGSKATTESKSLNSQSSKTNQSILDGIHEIEVFSLEREHKREGKLQERAKQRCLCEHELELEAAKFEIKKMECLERLNIEKEQLRIDAQNQHNQNKLVALLAQNMTNQAQAQVQALNLSQHSNQSTQDLQSTTNSDPFHITDNK